MPKVKTSYKPGQSGNPTGKPKGARNKLTTLFMEALASDFEKHGVKAIEDARDESPTQYMRTVAGLMEKQHKVEIPILEELKQLSKHELESRVVELGKSLRARGILHITESVGPEGPGNQDRQLLS